MNIGELINGFDPNAPGDYHFLLNAYDTTNKVKLDSAWMRVEVGAVPELYCHADAVNGIDPTGEMLGLIKSAMLSMRRAVVYCLSRKWKILGFELA